MLGKQCLREGTSLSAVTEWKLCAEADAAMGAPAVPGRRCVSEAQVSAASSFLRTALASRAGGPAVRP